MKFIDFHADTLSKIKKTDTERNLYSNGELSVDFKRMREAGQAAQFFAIFLPPEEDYAKEGIDYGSDDAYIYDRAELLKTNIEKYSDIVGFAASYSDFKKIRKPEK